MRQILKVTSLV